MWRVLNALAPLLILVVIVYVFRTEVFVASHQALRLVAPCAVPISYKIVSIDPRFDISTSSVEEAAEKAIAVWEKAAGKNLFDRAEGSAVVSVRLVFDLRQETTEALKEIGGEISEKTKAYELLEREFLQERAQFTSTRSIYEGHVAAYEKATAEYQREVDSWNEKGGAPSNVVVRLNAEKARLLAWQKELVSEQGALNAAADDVNALASRLNERAKELNISARTYNKVGAQAGEEFEEGLYERAAGREDISIFEFDSRSRLTRLLTHEFGHALGLDHVKNAESIMYELNQSTNLVPTDEDIAELDRACRSE